MFLVNFYTRIFSMRIDGNEALAVDIYFTFYDGKSLEDFRAIKDFFIVTWASHSFYFPAMAFP